MKKSNTLKLLSLLDKHFEEFAMIILIVVIIFVSGLQIFMRFIISSPLSWAEELCKYSFILSGFFSIGYCIKEGNVIRIDVILNKLTKPIKPYALIIIELISVVLFLFLFIYSFKVIEMSANLNQITPALYMPMKVLYSIMTINFFLAIVRSLQQIVSIIKNDIRLFQTRDKIIQEED